jgi:hypothetical protein
MLWFKVRRPTFGPSAGALPLRHWRTRSDPFASGWSQVREWLDVDPDLTGLELFERLQRQSPGVYPDGQLRTLQRRLKHWRMGMARSLVFGVHASAAKKELPRAKQADAFYGGFGSTTQPRQSETNAAIKAGPRNMPTSPNDSIPPRIPSNTHRNGSFAPSPMIIGRTK